MRIRLITALSLFLLTISQCSFAKSPCDGIGMEIYNISQLTTLVVSHIELHRNSTITPITSGMEVPPGAKVPIQIGSGKGSWGNAKGLIELHPKDKPEQTIRLKYGCTKIISRIMIINKPRAEAERPFTVKEGVSGTMTTFDIYGP